MKDERLEALLHGYFDGQLSTLEAEELDARIRTEPAARRRFWELARVHGELRIWGEREAVRGQLQLTVEQMEYVPSNQLEGRRSGWQRWAIGLAAAAALVLLGTFLGGARIEMSGAKELATKPSLGSAPIVPLGRILVDSGAIYSPGKSPTEGGTMSAGAYELIEGSAHMRLANGVDLTLQAPVSFVLHNLLRVTLHSGSLRALVPEGAHGFTIEAPEARFEDLGTEFGVEVDSNGRSALRVFEGEVRVKPLIGEQALAVVPFGQSVEVEGKILRPVQALSEAALPSMNAVAYRRWQRETERLRMDPSLGFYYAFEPDPVEIGRLKDCAISGVHTDGSISGASWVAGRWPGKMALQFENPGDCVQLAIPGNYSEFTLAAWIRIDRLDQPLNAILNTNGWDIGGFHWQVNRSGSVQSSGIFGGHMEGQSVTENIPLGQWVHLAVVLDAQAHQLRHYLNGKLIGSRSGADPNFRASFKAASIGRLEGWIPEDHRELRGRMDELVLWRRALSEPELQHLAEIAGTNSPIQNRR